MDWRRYKNELIVAAAFSFLLLSLAYKQGQISTQNDASKITESALHELKEVIALKKVWGDKRITKKVDKLKTFFSPSKVKWHRKSKKLTASFSKLSASELNTLVSKLMSMPVEIQRLDIKKLSTVYSLELKCKW